ncbi:MAG: hypothetical protein H6652_22290 [Ardenticatenaceae bacterium]|nr:hypothetical protein [Ardenticatenaceae bacterium]MCB8947763.1 hypothetical protein [Ardenticatenaceae bacterium]
MDVQDPRLRTLLRQADKVARAGKRAAAEQLYRQLLEEGPDVAEAWYGLGQVLYDPAEQKDAYQKALSLKPDYAAAARALAELQGEPIPEWAVAPEPEPEEEETPEVVEPEPLPEPTAVPDDTAQEYDLVCYRHPNRTTSLRCYNCGKPICSSCAVKTPVGYSCPDCIREKEDLFFNAKPLDYVIAPAIGLVLSLITGYLVVRFTLGGSFFLLFLMLFVGGLVGRFIGQFSKQAIGRRRGRYLPQAMAAVLILGTVVWLLPILLLAGFGSIGAFFGPGIYLFAAVGALYSYMK